MAAGSDLAAAARVALACLDLTSLNDGDTAADVAKDKLKGLFGGKG